MLLFPQVGFYSNFFLFKLMTWKMLLAGAILGFGGFSLGAIAARIFGLSVPQVKAVSIEVAMQNGAVALVVLKLSLPNPDADVGMVPAVTQMLVTGMPLFILVVVFTFWEWRRKRSVSPTPSVRVQQSLIPDEVKQIPSVDDSFHHDGNLMAEQTKMTNI